MDTIVASLSGSAEKIRQELQLIAILGLSDILPFVTVRTGVRYKETVGTLSTPAELRDYTGEKNAVSGHKITARTLETFLGSCVMEFDPNELRKTIFGSGVASGAGTEKLDVNTVFLRDMMTRISGGLNRSIFSAVREEGSATTAKLFNGFDAITTTDIAAGDITVAKGNLVEFSAPITRSNAVDALREYYWGASAELQGIATNMYVSREIYNNYLVDYQATVGAVPYNTEFKKLTLEGSGGLCTLAPVVSKTNSPYLHLSPTQNMQLGCYQLGDFENIEVRRGDNPFLLQFICTMFFGTQMESIDASLLKVGKLVTP